MSIFFRTLFLIIFYNIYSNQSDDLKFPPHHIVILPEIKQEISSSIQNALAPVDFVRYTSYQEISPVLQLLHCNFHMLKKLAMLKKQAQRKSDIELINKGLLAISEHWDNLYASVHDTSCLFRKMYDFIPLTEASTLNQYSNQVASFYTAVYEYNSYQIYCFNNNFSRYVERYQAQLLRALNQKNSYTGYYQFYKEVIDNSFIKKANKYKEHLWSSNKSVFENIEQEKVNIAMAIYKYFFQVRYSRSLQLCYDYLLSRNNVDTFKKEMRTVLLQFVRDINHCPEGLSIQNVSMVNRQLILDFGNIYKATYRKARRFYAQKDD